MALQSEESRTEPRPTQEDEAKTTPKSLEERYIGLLEKKIALLEEQLLSAKDDAKGKTEGADGPQAPDGKDEGDAKTNGEKLKNGKADEAESSVKDETKSRVRYIERKLDFFGEYNDKEVNGFSDLELDDGEQKTSAKEKENDYVIAWRRTQSSSGEPGKRELLIQSESLRKVLKEMLPDYPLSFDTKDVVIDAPYEVIYHNWDKIKAKADDTDSNTERDLKILLKEVGQVQATKRDDAQSLVENREITFPLLWTLFPIGTKVCQRHMDDVQVSIVAPGSPGSTEKYELELWSIDYDGTQFQCLQKSVSIKSFKGTKSITDLDVFPLKYWASADGCKTEQDLCDRLVARGRVFEELCNASIEKNFRTYIGKAITMGSVEMLTDLAVEQQDTSSDSVSTVGAFGPKTQEETLKFETNALVIIDHFAYLEYGGKALKLGDQKVSHSVCSCTSCTRIRKNAIPELPRKESGKPMEKLNDEQLLLCPPRVFGFIIREKKWAQMLVSQVQHISKEGREDAFKKLELDKNSKEHLKLLVTQHAKQDKNIDDLIPGKGSGLVVLLHGPPGVGKTLTAESLAMLANKPLYTVSMSDVGTSPVTVERNFSRIFELATRWKALLLFDEADVFLQARTLEDLRRNSLVSVLIRILEYFQGILFLTSNRVKIFDEAFQSRIHLAIRYRDLQAPQRVAIWNLWIEKSKEDIADLDLIEAELESDGDLYKAELNGRQIRNTFRSAMTIAKARGPDSKMTWKDLNKVLKATVSFQQYMVQNEELAQKHGHR